MRFKYIHVFALMAAFSLGGCSDNTEMRELDSNVEQSASQAQTPEKLDLASADIARLSAVEEVMDGPDEAETEAETENGTRHALLEVDVEVETQRISMSDGVSIPAIIARPLIPGSHPLVVMPGSWGVNYLEYAIQAKRLAERGYIAISYTSRGFWGAGGEIDFADRRTIQDASEIIDWALRSHLADPQRIAIGGISYGATAALLASARDNRIKTVFSLSGWTDLAQSVYFNDTSSSQIMSLLSVVGQLTGNPSPVVEALFNESKSGSISNATLTNVLDKRSVINELDALNANRPDILMVHGWNDSIFPPQQLLDFVERYQGNSRLLMTRGDHATHDQSGNLGLPNQSWDEVNDWLDKYLLDKPISTNDAGVVLHANNTDKVTSIDDFKLLRLGNLRYQLSAAPDQSNSTVGELAARADTPNWEATVSDGVNTGASSGTSFITGISADFFGFFPTINFDRIASKGGAVWKGPLLWRKHTILGQPKLQLQLEAGASDSTVFVYLYDIAPTGRAKLITHAPYSVRGIAPGETTTLDIEFHAIHWTVPAGHRIGLALDAHDNRYQSINAPKQSLSVSGSRATIATLDIPLLP